MRLSIWRLFTSIVYLFDLITTIYVQITEYTQHQINKICHILTRHFFPQQNRNLHKNRIVLYTTQSFNQTFFKILLVPLMLLLLLLFSFCKMCAEVFCWHTCMQHTHRHSLLTHIYIEIKWASANTAEYIPHTHTHMNQHTFIMLTCIPIVIIRHSLVVCVCECEFYKQTNETVFLWSFKRKTNQMNGI